MADEVRSSLQMSDITKCSICLEIYKEPKVLPCIHTFCRECLQNSFHDKDAGDEAACPLCRRVFSVPAGGVQNIQSNFFMNQLLQVTQSMFSSCSTKSVSTTECELCAESVSASSFCVECQQSICDKCATTHKKIKALMSHQVVPFKSMTNVDQRMKLVVHYCEQHPDKQIELYCYDCKLATCLMCYVTNHNTHKCTDVKKAGEEFSALLMNDIKNVSACAFRSKKKLEQIETNKKHFLQEVADKEKQITHKYEEFVSLLQSRKQQLMEELHLFRDRRLKIIANDKDEVERELASRESFNMYCQEIKDKGTACDISRAVNSLHARAEELVSTKDTSVISDHCGDGPIITFEPSFMTTEEHVRNWIGELFFMGEDVQRDTLDFKVTAFLNEPKLLHVILENDPIYGAAVLGVEVFIPAHHSTHQYFGELESVKGIEEFKEIKNYNNVDILKESEVKNEEERVNILEQSKDSELDDEKGEKEQDNLSETTKEFIEKELELIVIHPVVKMKLEVKNEDQEDKLLKQGMMEDEKEKMKNDNALEEIEESDEEDETEESNEKDDVVLNVYNTISFSQTCKLTIPYINGIETIVACSSSNCLYILSVDNIVYRYDLTLNSVVTKWSLGEVCYLLFITRSYTVLAILKELNEIREYTPDGSLIRKILLDRNMDKPYHCSQQSNGVLVVSHGNFDSKESGVSIVDDQGRAVKTYCGLSGHGVGQMNTPAYIAVDKYDNIVVSDTLNNRIEILSPTLIHLGYVQIPGYKLNRPHTLHLDEPNRRLYIGELGGGRMFVLEAADCKRTKTRTEDTLSVKTSSAPMSLELQDDCNRNET